MSPVPAEGGAAPATYELSPFSFPKPPHAGADPLANFPGRHGVRVYAEFFAHDNARGNSRLADRIGSAAGADDVTGAKIVVAGGWKPQAEPRRLGNLTSPLRFLTVKS